MGCVFSPSQEEIRIENERLYQHAVELYLQRVKDYKYYIHGDYQRYLYYIRGQFQLDCLPESVKYGANYNRENDADYNRW